MLRMAGLFLLLTYGWSKAWFLARGVLAGQPLATSGLAPLIAHWGLPAAGWLGLYVTLCESVGALFIALGFLTRVAAVALVLSMSGAFIFSLTLPEEPLRAALYVVLFGALAIAGPGRYSLDAWIRAKAVARCRD